MGKSSKKIRGRSILDFIIYLIVISLLSYVIIINNTKIEEINKKNDSYKLELSKLKKEYKRIKKDVDNLKKDIEELSNLDNKIITEKNKTFKLASEVEIKIKNSETNKKIAYFTFDDGPYYLTDSVLALLKEYKVKATFFTIGAGKDTCFDNKKVSCMETYKKIVDNNHTIANHTYSHAIFRGLYSSSDNFTNEVKKQEKLIYEKTGVITNILRFPGGSTTAGKLKDNIIKWLRENNYGWVDWTAQDGDGGDLKSTNQAWNTFKNSINDNIEVILFHDYSDITYSILPDAIKYLEDNNYILLPLFYDSVMINK